MKIEHLLARHFYTAKQLTLQGIGTFTLSPDFILPAETDKEAVIPQGVITFAQNNKATEDTALIDFIVQQTRKMKPLASSDLDSFISLGSQFLNIGKPFKIEGVGVLEKNQLGQYLFTQYGQIVNTKSEDTPVQQVKEKRDETISFASEEKSNPINGKKITAILAVLIVIGGLAWAGWYFFMNSKPDTAAVQTASVNTSTTAAPDTSKKDTTALAVTTQKPDSTATVTNSNTGYTFKVIIKTYPSLVLAQKAYTRLTGYGHKLLMYTADSVTYKLAMPLSLPLSDTAYAKDSIRKKLFGGSPYIELK